MPSSASSQPVQAELDTPVTFPVDLSGTQTIVRIGLLLPTGSEALREAAAALRAGFQAAYEREPGDILVDIIETGDAPQEMLSGYAKAAAANDIVVGPMSRTGVAAVAQSGTVTRPTIALTPPDSQDDGSKVSVPRQMLVIGLSIEDDARQVAEWAANSHPASKAVVLSTPVLWQRRAARAFEAHWQQQGREVESVELTSNDGFLSGRELMQLQEQLQPGTPVFVALDAKQARQVRAILGKEAILYGTSQLNPYALWDRGGRDPMVDMDGTRLVDIPWQIQADHPAVMGYPRLVSNADQQRSADFERLYALGIDAYRVAREIAAQRTHFEIDGVTGRLSIRFDAKASNFQRKSQAAVYRAGSVISTAGKRQ